jgi:hypothetical protein
MKRILGLLIALLCMAGLAYAQGTIAFKNDCQLKVRYQRDENKKNVGASLYFSCFGESTQVSRNCKGSVTYDYRDEKGEAKTGQKEFDIHTTPFRDTTVMQIDEQGIKIKNVEGLKCN